MYIKSCKLHQIKNPSALVPGIQSHMRKTQSVLLMRYLFQLITSCLATANRTHSIKTLKFRRFSGAETNKFPIKLDIFFLVDGRYGAFARRV